MIEEETLLKLQPYLFHGVTLNWSSSSDAKGDCPFCGKEDHFFVNQENGMWNCKVCAEGTSNGGGNIYTFMQLYWEQCKTLGYEKKDIEKLSSLRGLKPSTFSAWGLVKSTLTDEWMLPCFNLKGTVVNLYRYVKLKKSDGSYRNQWIGTKGLNQALFGINLFKESITKTVIGEGPWDGMALWEAFTSVRRESDSFVRTADKRESLIGEYNVLAVPGCEQFTDKWALMLKGHKIVLPYDNDHPKKNPTTKAIITPAGYRGMEKAVNTLSPYTKDIEIIDWGPDGYDRNLKSGYDMSDAYREKKPVGFVTWLNSRLISSPENWLRNAGAPKDVNGSSIEPIECTNYKELVGYWKKALKWTEVLDATLSVCIACCVGTDMKSQSDSVWIRVMGAPGTAKSTFCEALSISHHTFPTSVQKGFHSGYTGRGDDEDDRKDSSLIPLIKNKTVIIKDGDTLINASNRDATLAELRDIYDGTSRAHYRNKKSSVYKGINTTFILAGTKSLKRLNRSYLGDRFLDCIIYDRSERNKSLEDEILSRAAFGALHCMRQSSDGTEEGLVDERLVEAWKRTAGYLNWLRHEEANGKPRSHNLLQKVNCSEEVVLSCMRMGEFVSYMRARPDKDLGEEESAEVELATRLSRQFVRLANQLAVVLNKESIDEAVMERVCKVARDTGRGLTLQLVQALYSVPAGLDSKHLAIAVKKDQQSITKYLKFLHSIRVVRPYKAPNGSAARGRHRHLWELTPTIRSLYKLINSYRVITTKSKQSKELNGHD